MDAALRGNIEIVNLLIDKSADINPKDNDCGSALSLTKIMGYMRIVDLLFTHGASE